MTQRQIAQIRKHIDKVWIIAFMDARTGSNKKKSEKLMLALEIALTRLQDVQDALLASKVK